MFTHHRHPRVSGSGSTTSSTIITKKPSLLSRLTRPVATRSSTTRRHRPIGSSTVGSTATRPRRRTSISDKISGALLKLKGSLTGRPGQKAAGTRRMRGTDGRGVHTATTATTRRRHRVGGRSLWLILDYEAYESI
ncbi:hypothetical protein BZA77DRAFT_346277 [Pyronema omphalodes]|nr:hypothetical protein BZA77DRAFT_346277 [Pyronema omphalodes]